MDSQAFAFIEARLMWVLIFGLEIELLLALVFM